MADSSAAVVHYAPADPSRRDFLSLIATAGAAIGVAAIAWPFLDSMNPSADVLALSAVEADLAPIAVGSGITIMWQGKPTFVRHRTPEETKSAQDVPLNQLYDTSGRVRHGPAPANLPVPPCAFESDTKIKVG